MIANENTINERLKTCDKKELLDAISNLRFYGVSGIDEILSNPNLDQEAFEQLIRVVSGKNNIEKLLQSPLMSEENLHLIFERCYYDTSSHEAILKSPFLTEEVYKRVLATKPYGLIDLLLQSPFAGPYTCSVLLSGRPGTELEDDVILKLAKSPCLTGEIIARHVPVFARNDEILLELLQNHTSEDGILSSFLSICFKDPQDYPESLKYLILHYKGMLKEMYYEKYAELGVEQLSFIMTNGLIEEENLKEMIQNGAREDLYGTRKIAMNVVKSPYATEDLLITITRQNLRDPRNGYDDFPSTLQKAMLTCPAMTEKVLCKIITDTPYNVSEEVREAILSHPLAGKDLKVAVINAKDSLSNNEIDLLFAIPDLTEENLIEVIEKHKDVLLFKRILDSKYSSKKIMRCILEQIQKGKLREKAYDGRYDKSFLLELMDRDMDESNLYYIITAICSDYSVVKKALEHPSVGLDVCKKASILSDNFSREQGEEIAELASLTKQRIVSEMFEIEVEEDVTDMLRVNVEDGITTMLWGPSGVGKSSRIYEIDPKATMLILKDGMLPEEVVGGKEPNGKPGEIYPPHWYEILCRKCEEEPDRMHILFIDEFTNVDNKIKNLVWEVVGNRLVKGNEEWPLPRNCSVVIAGNRPEESTAVRIDINGGVMPAPLHNRVVSMLEIKFSIDEWQKWALETNPETGRLRIHPIVLSFCAAHAEKVMFTEFNPEDITKPFLTPRKWEQLSDAIYQAEARGPRHHVSYERVKSIIGDTQIYNAFIDHYERVPLDMNKIIMGEYTEEDFPSLEDKLYALGMVVAQYEGDQETIEAFILDCLGDEFLSVYNNMKNERKAALEGVGANAVTNRGHK